MFEQDATDRTLPPTDRRRREARARGEFARSTEITSAASLLAFSIAFWWFVPTLVAALAGQIRDSLTTTITQAISMSTAVEWSWRVGRLLVMLILPFWGILFAILVIANVSQTGWLWVPAAIAPRFRQTALMSWDRVAGITGLVLRLFVLGGTTWVFFNRHQRQLDSLGLGQPDVLLLHAIRLIGQLSIQLSICLVLLALADYGFRFWRHEQRLKMTIEERRREQREDAAHGRIKARQTMSVDRFEPFPPSIESVQRS